MAATLVGCSHPPLLALSQKACSATPDLTGATSVKLGATFTANSKLNADSACLETTNGRENYAVFRLPDTSQPYSVSVRSHVVFNTVVGPHLSLLNASGKTIREVGVDAFVARGDTIEFGFRPQPDEKLVVVQSDARLVGKQVSNVKMEVREYYVPLGTGVMPIKDIQDGVVTTTYAYNGLVEVTAEPLKASQ
jgi:hypothetical protein